MFQGFNEETIAFLWGVRFNNERGWFEQNKPSYINNVYEPIKALGFEVFEELRTRFPDQEMICKVSRIYRDARRLFGRGPYKDHLWFSVRQPAEEWVDKPTFWFELAPEEWSYGMGYWVSKPATMAKLRNRIDRDPAAMEELTRKLNRQTEFVLNTADYKKPRSQAPSELLEPWYRAKYFSIGHEEKLTEELFSRDIVDRLKQGYEFLLPYYDYFLTLSSDAEPTQL